MNGSGMKIGRSVREEAVTEDRARDPGHLALALMDKHQGRQDSTPLVECLAVTLFFRHFHDTVATACLR